MGNGHDANGTTEANGYCRRQASDTTLRRTSAFPDLGDQACWAATPGGADIFVRRANVVITLDYLGDANQPVRTDLLAAARAALTALPIR